MKPPQSLPEEAERRKRSQGMLTHQRDRNIPPTESPEESGKAGWPGRGFSRTPCMALHAPFGNEKSHALFSRENAQTHNSALFQKAYKTPDADYSLLGEARIPLK